MYNGIADIRDTWLDYPDNISQASEVFLTGCNFSCIGCQNIELQTSIAKQPYETLVKQIKAHTEKTRTTKIVFVGGEPLLPHNTNQAFLKRFLEEYGDRYQVCVYTGYSVSYAKEIGLRNFAYLKTGKYIHSKACEVQKTGTHMQLASSNQELYNAKYELLSHKGKITF